MFSFILNEQEKEKHLLELGSWVTDKLPDFQTWTNLAKGRRTDIERNISNSSKEPWNFNFPNM